MMVIPLLAHNTKKSDKLQGYGSEHRLQRLYPLSQTDWRSSHIRGYAVIDDEDFQEAVQLLY